MDWTGGLDWTGLDSYPMKDGAGEDIPKSTTVFICVLIYNFGDRLWCNLATT